MSEYGTVEVNGGYVVVEYPEGGNAGGPDIGNNISLDPMSETDANDLADTLNSQT